MTRLSFESLNHTLEAQLYNLFKLMLHYSAGMKYFGFLAKQLPVGDENRVTRSTVRLVPYRISAPILFICVFCK